MFSRKLKKAGEVAVTYVCKLQQITRKLGNSIRCAIKYQAASTSDMEGW